MDVSKALKSIWISMVFVVGLTGCDKPGPAETAGKKIDQVAADAGKKIDETTNKISEKLGEKSDSAGVAIDDATITTKVKAAIFSEPGLQTLQISVDTVKGVVTLTGSVDSLQSSAKVKTMAAAIAGVKEVDNKLVVK